VLRTDKVIVKETEIKETKTKEENSEKNITKNQRNRARGRICFQAPWSEQSVFDVTMT